MNGPANMGLPEIQRFQKKLTWLPGPSVVIPDQVCAFCRVGSHGVSAEAQLVQTLMFGSAEQDYVPLRWRCTCPDPSHAEGEP